MIELEREGFSLVVGSIHPPLTSMRHEHAALLAAPVHYAPPQPILQLWEELTKAAARWPAALVEAHNKKYGPQAKAALRARNACYFADFFARREIDHVHVHFANRAAHTALFLRDISGISFSVTAHGQDFMADLGSDELLQEICAAAEFVAVETDYSRGLLAARCPASAAKIHRVYNGMDLALFPSQAPAAASTKRVKILSIGRLVPFKGFEHLLKALANLHDRARSFACEIVGDGPLRESLQRKINDMQLSHVVRLTGALPQEEVIAKLRDCDLFVLASVTDRLGASDIFPTVILEAMSAGKPVVSTSLAGIPEAVADRVTGLLVPPGDDAALAEALDTLIRNPELRSDYGRAGRIRVEREFQIRRTVQPLTSLLRTLSEPGQFREPSEPASSAEIAYLIDLWPDEELPLIGEEVFEMQRRGLPITGFVFRAGIDPVRISAQKEMATRLEFLPDAIVIEAEWKANQELVAQLENNRANQAHRAPADAFLRQARFANALRRAIIERRIQHVHATSSRSLLCALMLKEVVGVTISAAIERNPELPRSFLQVALKQCVGARVRDSQLIAGMNGSFLVERRTGNTLAEWAARRVTAVTGIDLTRRKDLWQEWSGYLARWSCGTRVDMHP
ncbi:MAG: glycosyltransferase family 4 protein [Chthoniobacterales bacterium]